MNEIEKLLLKLNFNISHNKGFEYWIESLIYTKDKGIFKVGDVYKYLAQKYETSWEAVERAMRICAKSAKENLKKKYGEKYTLSNKVILKLLRLELKGQKNG